MRVVLQLVVAAGAALLVAGCTQPDGPGVDPREFSTVTEDAPLDAVLVTRRDFEIRYRLDAVTAQGSAVPLLHDDRLVLDPAVASGTTVERGDRLGDAVVDPDAAASLELLADASPIDAARLEMLRAREGPIDAPVAGILDLEDPVAVVRGPGLDVVVELNPLQELRLRAVDLSGEAVVETVVGRRQVPCDAVWLTRRPDGVQESEAGPADQAAPSALRCRLPRHVDTVAGLRAELVVESSRLQDVIVVPNVYVGHDAEADTYVVTVRDNGEPRTIPVSVGPTDGVVRVILSDLPVGAELVAAEDTG